MPVRLPVASWSLCTETRLTLSIQGSDGGFVIRLSGNDQSCCEEYGPYEQLGIALEEVNKRFGMLLERK